MQKVPRFMREYANFQHGKLWDDSSINEGIKYELIRRIEAAVFNYAFGSITVDEAMRIISTPDNHEDMSEYIR